MYIINLLTVKAQTSLRIRTVSPEPLLISSNAGTDPLKNHEVTKPALNVGPPLVRQRYAISFKWCFAGGQMLARLCWYLDRISLQLLRKKHKNVVKVGLLWQNFLYLLKMCSLHCEKNYDEQTLSIL